jgi:hypothetical protein
VNTLEQALDLRDLVGEGAASQPTDVYHVWWDPNLYRQIARAGAKRQILAHTSVIGWCRRQIAY